MTSPATLSSVAIVIPAKDEERFIGRCLQAVRDLDLPAGSVEIVLVDNGSTDRTAEIAAEFGARVISSEGTVAKARNVGAAATTGEVLAFLDADSMPRSDWLSEGLRLLDDDEVAAVGFQFQAPGPDSVWIDRTWSLLSTTSKLCGTRDVSWLCTFNVLVKRSAFDAIQGFREELVTCEDVDLGERLHRTHRLLFSDKSEVRHLDTPQTLPAFFKKERWRGASSLQSFRAGPPSASSLLSTFVPPLYLLVLVAVLPAALLLPIAGWILAGIGLAVPLLFALYKSGGFKLSQLGPVWLLAAIYLIARGAALLLPQAPARSTPDRSEVST